MYWHIDTDIVSLIVIAAIYVCNLKLPQEGMALRNRRFLRCLETGVVVTLIDIVASIIMEVPVPRWLYHTMMTAYFACIELVIVEWFLYVLTILYEKNERRRKTAFHVVLGVYAAYVLFVCANPWTGHIYTLGPNGEYSRGPLFFMMLVLYALYTLALFVLTLVRWRNIPKGYPTSVLLLTPVLIAAGITAQLAIPGWLLIMPAYMVCLVLAFLFLQTMRVRNSQELVENLYKVAETDLLTGLFNRNGMETMVQRTLHEAYGRDVLVLIADIDDLKGINDTMGHAEGDRAIQLVATQIRKHFRTSDTVVRYGGDEFLAFLTGELNEAQMHRSLQQLVAEMGALRIGEKDDVPLHGSVGAAYGVVGQDTFESLCFRADTALYHVKRNGKNGYAFYKPEMERVRPLSKERGGKPMSAS